MKTTLYALLLGILVCVRGVPAQEAMGYSAIDWDYSSNSVIGYSETDLDPDVAAYYEARVYATIQDQNGTVIASDSNIDTNSNNGGETDVTLDAPGQYGITYTINGSHSGRMYYSYQDDGCTTRDCVNYDDFFYFDSFGDPDVGAWASLIGPGPENYIYRPVLYAMSTEDSDSVTPNCGDDRDTLLQEYATNHIAGLSLTCASFTTGHSTPYLNAAELLKCCPSHPTQEFQWILQSEEYLSMITAWYSHSGFPVNSAYRDPVQNRQCGGAMPPSQPPSRHMFGDAVDAGNPSHTQSDWQALYDASKQAGSDWREPIIGPCGVACVHGDMRYHGPTYVN